MQSLIQTAWPTADVYGHPRKNWDPLPLEDGSKPEKGVFVVKVDGKVLTICCVCLYHCVCLYRSARPLPDSLVHYRA